MAETSIPVESEAPAPRRVAPFVVLAVTVVIGVLFVVLAGSDSGQQSETADTPLLGKAAPQIEGDTIDGSAFQLSTLRGQWVVLNFFQSTCVPCVQEHPELVEFDRQQAQLADGARLVTVVWNDDPAPVREFFADNGGGWPIVLDDSGTTAFDYGVAKVPETWVIDPNGRVQVHFISKVTAADLAARVQTLRVLAGAGG